ncbi:MAG: hypothetical protein L6R41_004055 [Letrouitia leprolyta]|nr:MAG: hypothetical protein L6R41_004055 [Letrouitia leprolyta]
MVPKSNVLSKKTEFFPETASRVFDSTLDVPSWPSACHCVDLDPVGLDHPAACMAWTSISPASAPSSPGLGDATFPLPITSKPYSAPFRENTPITPPVVQEVKLELEISDFGGFLGANLAPEQQLYPGSTKESNTIVDALVRTIQLKSRRPTSHQPVPRARNCTSPNMMSDPETGTPRPKSTNRGHQRDRRAYKCSIPSCDKTFYQKAHLEIHVRAHTGYKPFVRGDSCNYRRALLLSLPLQVCKTVGCGHRFSQLGNLKVELIDSIQTSKADMRSRHMSVVTQAKDHIRAKNAARDLRNVATSAHT